jgi:GNAT superfamily N-acetyltransferase
VEGWRIVPFAPRHAEGVARLITGIQRGEFGLDITLADQPDLTDIDGFYARGPHGPGCFLVAEDESGGVCGTIALRNIGGGRGALRKMFVARGLRGAGLAADLLEALTAWCAQNGVRSLWLGTTERFLAAHRFYEKHGFTRVEKSDLPPAFPLMAVDSVFYARPL